ncbi:MAG: hypothetical protein EOO77_33065 [Oxalobacteraceae bacterium]|nr:MAG: hypothetical protein EOO77_33065 [Oxalobacteraceae bacterium]
MPIQEPPSRLGDVFSKVANVPLRRGTLDLSMRQRMRHNDCKAPCFVAIVLKQLPEQLDRRLRLNPHGSDINERQMLVQAAR